MIPALLPANEPDRLQMLRNLDLLDTPPDPVLDALTAAAAAIADCPLSMFTLIDADRMHVKARSGLALGDSPRDLAFCAWAILGEELFEVHDIAADPRFASHPALQLPTPLRFYAGVPVGVSGCAVGALCVADVRPRHLDPRGRKALSQLGSSISNWLAQRLTHLQAHDDAGQALLPSASAVEVSCNRRGGFHLSLRAH